MTVNEAFPEWKTGKGIFWYLAVGEYKVPWESSKSSSLDVQYHAVKSGNREIGPLLQAYIVNGKISNEDKAVIANSILALRAEEWTRIYNAMFAEYNPIENYSATETGKDTRTNTGTLTNSNETIHGHKVQSENSNNITSAQSTYGFDNGSDTPSGKEVTQDGGTGTETHSGTDTTTDTRIDNLTEINEHSFKRSGNIGVTTSQQMIESEIELREKSYFDIIFADLDKYLTIRVY